MKHTPMVVYVVGAVLALGLLGCPDDVAFVRDIPGGCEAEPVFLLTSPNPDSMQTVTDTLDISVDVGIFQIVDKLGQARGVCEGHFHLSIDGGPIVMMTTTSMAMDISHLDDGEHTLTMTVHHNDHSRVESTPSLFAVFLVSD